MLQNDAVTSFFCKVRPTIRKFVGYLPDEILQRASEWNGGQNRWPTGLRPGQEASQLWTTLSLERDQNSKNRAVCENQHNESVTMAVSFFLTQKSLL